MLVLGFIGLQAGHAQNRFYNELEEWLSGVTHLIDKAEGSVPGFDDALKAPQGSREIENQLVLMNKELRENNRIVGQLIEGRQPAASAPQKQSVAAMGA